MNTTPRFSPVSIKPVRIANTVGIILAAGMGKRMKSTLAKVAHPLLGKPLVLWAVDAMREAGVDEIVVVLSPLQSTVAECVRAHDDRLHIAWQSEAKGTGHAALCGLDAARAAIPLLAEQKNYEGSAGGPNALASTQVLVGFGDTPAVRADTFARYLEAHGKEGNGVTVFAFSPSNPGGYGRVLTEQGGAFRAIREDKDCTPVERETRLCNSGFLCARGDILADLLPALGNDNAAGEHYLTDVPAAALARKERVGIFHCEDELEVAGVNSQEQLAGIARYVQHGVLRSRMAEGVCFLQPDAVYVEPTVTFGEDVSVEPFVFLAGRTHIPSGTRVAAFTRLVDDTRV